MEAMHNLLEWKEALIKGMHGTFRHVGRMESVLKQCYYHATLEVDLLEIVRYMRELGYVDHESGVQETYRIIALKARNLLNPDPSPGDVVQLYSLLADYAREGDEGLLAVAYDHLEEREMSDGVWISQIKALRQTMWFPFERVFQACEMLIERRNVPLVKLRVPELMFQVELRKEAHVARENPDYRIFSGVYSTDPDLRHSYRHTEIFVPEKYPFALRLFPVYIPPPPNGERYRYCVLVMDRMSHHYSTHHKVFGYVNLEKDYTHPKEGVWSFVRFN